MSNSLEDVDRKIQLFCFICQSFQNYILFSIPMNKENFVPLNTVATKIIQQADRIFLFYLYLKT